MSEVFISVVNSLLVFNFVLLLLLIMEHIFKSVQSLKSLCVNTIIYSFDKVLDFYSTRWNEIDDETRPDFGPVGYQPAPFLMDLIDEFVRRKLLRYKHLKVLLPREAVSLVCNENTGYSPFKLDVIELISKRCQDFEILHYHQPILEKEKIPFTNTKLRNSILRLKNLQEISFYDSEIESQTIRVISSNCVKLVELNLLRTNLNDEGLGYLHDEESVIKNSLTTLIIDETPVSEMSVGQCLLNLRNLTHFQFDKTIKACLRLYENRRIRSEIVSPFETSIFKSRLNIVTSKRLSNTGFQNWLVKIFPRVKHAILIGLTESRIPFVEEVLDSWEHLEHLELSFAQQGEEGALWLLQPTFENCGESLISLKLENFFSVDLCILEKIFLNLEKLTLINISEDSTGERVPFENLKQLEIVHCKYRSRNTDLGDEFLFSDLSPDALLHLFSSRKLEKIFIYDQGKFTNDLIENAFHLDYLKNLKELSVFLCPLKLSDFIINAFINEENPIKKFEVGLCPYIRGRDIKKISTIIAKNNYATVFTHAMEIPYYLRWLVLDIKNPI